MFFRKQGLNMGVFRQVLFAFILGLSSGCAFLIRTPVYDVEETPPPAPSVGPYHQLARGVFHVHSEYSWDSQASLDFIRKTAKKAELDFVVITDHNTREGAKLPKKEGPLLIFGIEHSQPEGHLISMGVREEPPKDMHSQDLIDWIHDHHGYAVIAHPVCKKNPWKDWSIQNFDGVEVYNFAHAFYPHNKVTFFLKSLLTPKGFLKAYQKTPHRGMDFWKGLRISYGRKTVAYGAADAHIHFKWLRFTPENFLLYLQSVTTYVWVRDKSERQIVDAMGQGRSFIAFEARGDAQQFSFLAKSGSRHYRSGDRVRSESPVQLKIQVPAEADIRIMRDGKTVEQRTGTHLSFVARESGNYYVEVYRGGELWILANPIVVAF